MCLMRNLPLFLSRIPFIYCVIYLLLLLKFSFWPWLLRCWLCSQCGFLCVYSSWNLLDFLNMYIPVLYQIWGFGNLIFQIFFVHLSFSSLLLGSSLYIYWSDRWCPAHLLGSVKFSLFFILSIPQSGYFKSIYLQVPQLFLLPVQVCYWNFLMSFSF